MAASVLVPVADWLLTSALDQNRPVAAILGTAQQSATQARQGPLLNGSANAAAFYAASFARLLSFQILQQHVAHDLERIMLLDVLAPMLRHLHRIAIVFE